MCLTGGFVRKVENTNGKLCVDCRHFVYLFLFQKKTANNSGGCVEDTKSKKTKRRGVDYERTCKAIY